MYFRPYTVILLFISSISWGQTAHSTLGSAHKLRINSNGTLGINTEDLSPASFYNETNNAFLRQAGLWITARDEQGNYHTAVQHLSAKDSFDFWPGPIDTLTGQTDEIATWDFIHEISSDDIIFHIQNYSNSGYIPSESIANWPAEGTGRFSRYLAPFIDNNNDGFYNPMDGDYPAIKGTEAIYVIFNDVHDEHTASFGAALDIEVQMMAYRFAESDVIYLEYFLINRRPTNFTEVNVGFFLDGECGLRTDNYAGTLEAYPQTIFVYNGDSTDEGFFKDELPYVGAVFLNENLNNSISFTEGNGKDGVPVTNSDFIRYSQGRWRDSSSLTLGGTGQEMGSPSAYIFTQSNLDISAQWTEHTEMNNSGTRTILGNIKKTQFTPKSHIKIDIALIAGTFESLESITSEVRQKAQNASAKWKDKSDISTSLKSFSPKVYPNPTFGSFKITSPRSFKELFITNNQGVTVFQINNIESSEFSCNVSLTPGVYHLTIISTSSVNQIPLLIIN